MHVQTDPEVHRLRAVLRDLVALSAVPAAWIESDPPMIAAGLADMLMDLLQLESAFVRLSDPGGVGAVEVTRGNTGTGFPGWLHAHLAATAAFPRKQIVPDIGEGRRGFAVSVGVNGERGVVAAASERSDFPTSEDELLLSLAANHAAAAFRSASLIHELTSAENQLRKARNDLEVKVAERTTQLARLADEQAALGRVATLVAQGVRPAELFSAVSDEVARLFGTAAAAVVKFDDDGRALVFVGVSRTERGTIPVGTRWDITDDRLASARVCRTGRSARMNARDWSSLDGPPAAAGRLLGLTSTVAAPISVEGRPWGAMSVSSSDSLLEHDTEERLEKFTELVATAIANAESRGELTLLAEEQTALRRIATLVARAVPPEEVFAAVTDEVGRLLGTDLAGMGCYGSDDTVTVVATWAAEGEHGGGHPLVPGPWALEGGDVASMVWSSARPVRIDDYRGLPGPIAAFVRDELKIQSSLASPIVVNGQLWGLLFLHSRQAQPLPRDTESRLTGFTELVGTAIANTYARAELARLAEQQAALRRVATLVAREAAPAEVFSAVTEEVGRLVGADIATLVRLEPGDTVMVVAAWSQGEDADQIPVGMRVPLEEGSVGTTVLRTGRPARRNNLEQASDSVSARARRLGVTSTIGTPIVVEGRLWGGMSVSSKQPTQLPADTESRIADFADLVATAIANAEARSELTASRARIVAAADETRRQIERDLHDGIQQRLVSLGLDLRTAQAIVPSQLDELEDALAQVSEGLTEVSEELRAISQGIHPAILTQGGLEPALKALCRRSAVPVELDLHAQRRLPEPVEVAAYYVVSEALTNAVKHAQASTVRVALEATDAVLELAIRDDGVGGAEPGGGSGLVGLSDRIEALGGTLRVTSSPGEGTTLRVRVPLEDQSAPVASR